MENEAGRHRVKLPPYPYAKQLVEQFEAFMGFEYCWYDHECFHQQLWLTYSQPSRAESRDRLWLCQLFAVVALGASYNTYDAPSIEVSNECDEDRDVGLHDSNPCHTNGDRPPGSTFFEQALALFRFPSEDVQIGHVEVLNLFVSLMTPKSCTDAEQDQAFYSYSLNRRRTAYMYSGMALRSASTLELGAHLEATFSDKSRYRHLLWCTTLILDTTTAIATGLPPAHSIDEVELQNLVKDDALEAGSSEPASSTLIFQHLKLCMIQTKIQRAISFFRVDDFDGFQSAIAGPLQALRRWKFMLPTGLAFDIRAGMPELMCSYKGMRSLASLYLRYEQVRGF